MENWGDAQLQQFFSQHLSLKGTSSYLVIALVHFTGGCSACLSMLAGKLGNFRASLPHLRAVPCAPYYRDRQLTCKFQVFEV